MSYLQQLQYDTTRQKVITTRGEDIAIKEHRGWRFINYEGKKIGVNTIPKLNEENDYVFNYVFGGQSENYPCPAMEYWIYRHRLGIKISTAAYKQKFAIKRK